MQGRTVEEVLNKGINGFDGAGKACCITSSTPSAMGMNIFESIRPQMTLRNALIHSTESAKHIRSHPDSKQGRDVPGAGGVKARCVDEPCRDRK